MKKPVINIFFSFFLTLLLFSFDVPSGWLIAGSMPKSYDMGIAIGEGRDGKNCATIQSKDRKINGFGTLMQKITPGEYLGKRIRLSAYLKSSNVEDWCGLWMRCDGENRNEILAFDNMKNRKVKGTTDWTKYEIVLDIPNGTKFLAFGALLGGTGKVWFDEFKFEVVDKSIPTTGIGIKELTAPQNLSFDE